MAAGIILTPNKSLIAAQFCLAFSAMLALDLLVQGIALKCFKVKKPEREDIAFKVVIILAALYSPRIGINHSNLPIRLAVIPYALFCFINNRASSRHQASERE